MMSFSLSGGVEVYGFIAPTEITDEYPVIDPLYGIDGFRNVDTLNDLNNIPTLRRRAGMVVGIGGGTQYYKLNPGPWNGTITDWTIFNSGGGGGTFTGGTVTGPTIFTNGLTANTLTVNGVSITGDTYTTGGTYSNGTIDFYYNTGGGYQVVGLYTGETSYVNSLTTGVGLSGDSTTGNITIINTDPDQVVSISGGTNVDVTGTYPNFNIALTGLSDNNIYTTGFTYSANTFYITDTSGNTFSATIDVMTGLTINGVLSATTYQNLPATSLTVGTTQITNGTSGRILFQSGTTLQQDGSLFWNNNNKDLEIDGVVSIGKSTLGVPYNPTVIDDIIDPINSAVTATIIYPKNFTNKRIFFGKSNRKIYDLILTDVFSGVFDVPNVSIRGGKSLYWTNGLAELKNDAGTPLEMSSYYGFQLRDYFNTDIARLGYSPTNNNSTFFGNVGIGTSSPSEKLDVSGKTKTINLQVTSGATSGYVLTSDSSGNATWQIPTVTADTYTTGFTYSANTFYITDTSGNTFSATIDVMTGLTINGNLNVTGTTSLQGFSATTISATTIGTSGNCVDDIYVSNIHSCSPLNINPLDEGNVYFGSTSGVTIDLTNNRVGIGTTSPSAGLNIKTIINSNVGNPGLRVSGSLNYIGMQYDEDLGPVFYTNYQVGTNNSFLFKGSTYQNLATIGTGGIFSWNTNGKISNFNSNGYINLWNGVSGDMEVVVATNNPIKFLTNNIERVRISNTGNVGIGNITPTEKLDVSGKTKTINLQVTSGATSGYVLTALDNSGNTQWVALGSNNNELDPVLTIIGTTASTVNIGDRFLISGGTGIWSGRTNQIAEYTGVTPTGYSYYIPVIDDVVFVTDTLTTYRFDGTNWISWRGTAILQNGNSLTTSVNIGSNNNQNLTFRTSGQTRVTISASTGNVGIGTTTPQARLHVAGTNLMSAATQNILTVIGSGNTTSSPIFTVQGSSGELFSVSDSLVGSLFSVNDISGLPILEVFSDNTTLMGSYLAPSLNTTARVITTTGTTNVYSIPTSAYTGAFFDYTVSDGTNLRAGNIMSIWSGTSVNITETQTTDFGNTSGLTFNMIVSSGNAILRTSGATGNWTVKTIVRSI